MTELLYQTDAYMNEFDAKISGVAVDVHAIILDQSAFYPGGGGQPCDFGTLVVGVSEYQVNKVKKQGDDVLHFIVGQEPLPEIGSSAHGKIDWDRRYKLMRTHTALHILCGTVFRDYGALVTGGDMEPLAGRMDFEFERMQAGLVHDIEAGVNREIANARDLRVKILNIRTVEIVGLDLQADGGTHVKNTSEVGSVRVVDYKSKGAINKRLYIAIE